MSSEVHNTQHTHGKNAGLWCLGTMFGLAAGGAAVAIWVLPPTIEATRDALDPVLSSASQVYSDKVKDIAGRHP